MASLPVHVAQRAAAKKTSVCISSSPTTHKKLQSSVHGGCHALFSTSNTWDAIIKLPVVPHYSDGGVSIDLKKKFNSSIEPCDIYSYIQNPNTLVDRLYLNPNLYPPIYQHNGDTLSEEEKKTVDDIIAHLKTKAQDSGSAVRTRNSCYNKGMKKFVVRFQCDVNHTTLQTQNDYKNNDDDLTTAATTDAGEEKKYRETHHVNNKNGNAKRHGAQRGAPNMPRRRNKKKEHVCPQGFSLRVDNLGFYISTNAGKASHQGHPKFDPDFKHTHVSSFTHEEKNDALHAFKATLNKAVGRNFVEEKWNKHMTRSQVALLDTLAKEGDEDDEFGSLCKTFEQSKFIRYNILWSKERKIFTLTFAGVLGLFKQCFDLSIR